MQYIIDIDDKPINDDPSNPIYKVKDFRYLYFSKNDLNKLQQYKNAEEPIFKCGDIINVTGYWYIVTRYDETNDSYWLCNLRTFKTSRQDREITEYLVPSDFNAANIYDILKDLSKKEG